jgi:hypothetical protein
MFKDKFCRFENHLEVLFQVVSRTTRGPANPIKAPGSLIFMSPSIANEAVVPPVVGSVQSDI